METNNMTTTTQLNEIFEKLDSITMTTPISECRKIGIDIYGVSKQSKRTYASEGFTDACIDLGTVANDEDREVIMASVTAMKKHIGYFVEVAKMNENIKKFASIMKQIKNLSYEALALAPEEESIFQYSPHSGANLKTIHDHAEIWHEKIIDAVCECNFYNLDMESTFEDMIRCKSHFHEIAKKEAELL